MKVEFSSRTSRWREISYKLFYLGDIQILASDTVDSVSLCTEIKSNFQQGSINDYLAVFVTSGPEWRFKSIKKVFAQWPNSPSALVNRWKFHDFVSFQKAYKTTNKNISRRLNNYQIFVLNCGET